MLMTNSPGKSNPHPSIKAAEDFWKNTMGISLLCHSTTKKIKKPLMNKSDRLTASKVRNFTSLWHHQLNNVTRFVHFTVVFSVDF